MKLSEVEKILESKTLKDLQELDNACEVIFKHLPSYAERCAMGVLQAIAQAKCQTRQEATG